MTSIDVILKGTDDYASSGFFHLKVSLRRRLDKTSPCFHRRRKKPGCWVIVFF
ncbi:hypothetical protein [Salisediminibacterium halotolerans]|uniref:hypothetical protein n=1 Tax=Salisediminibacterium halotolerans TaxID=517425 RepID=UPI0012B697D6|nr:MULTISPECIES: hypothetical protein [Salisediminibacterium]